MYGIIYTVLHAEVVEWQTQQTQNLPQQCVRVQVPSSAPARCPCRQFARTLVNSLTFYRAEVFFRECHIIHNVTFLFSCGHARFARTLVNSLTFYKAEVFFRECYIIHNVTFLFSCGRGRFASSLASSLTSYTAEVCFHRCYRFNMKKPQTTKSAAFVFLCALIGFLIRRHNVHPEALVAPVVYHVVDDWHKVKIAHPVRNKHAIRSV